VLRTCAQGLLADLGALCVDLAGAVRDGLMLAQGGGGSDDSLGTAVMVQAMVFGNSVALADDHAAPGHRNAARARPVD
jgi:hypothetical protein